MNADQEVKLLETILAKHLYSPGTEGFRVSIAGRNAVLTFLSESGQPKNISKARGEQVVALLTKHFPALDTDIFFGYCETVRRRQGLHSRWRNFVQSPGYSNFESLDPDNLRRGPLGLGLADFTSKPAAELPRLYTYVRTSPEPAERFIFMTEMRLGDLRPDEVIMRYNLSPGELELVKGGASFAEIPDDQRVARDLKIHCGDPNRQIPEKALAKHFEKTLAGELEAVSKATAPVSAKGLGLIPQGTISCSTVDTLVGPLEIKVAPGGSAVSTIRRTERGTVVRSAALIELKGGQPAVVTAPDEMLKAAGISDELIESDLRPLVQTFVKTLEALAAKLPKK